MRVYDSYRDKDVRDALALPPDRPLILFILQEPFQNLKHMLVKESNILDTLEWGEIRDGSQRGATWAKAAGIEMREHLGKTFEKVHLKRLWDCLHWWVIQRVCISLTECSQLLILRNYLLNSKEHLTVDFISHRTVKNFSGKNFFLDLNNDLSGSLEFHRSVTDTSYIVSSNYHILGKKIWTKNNTR